MPNAKQTRRLNVAVLAALASLRATMEAAGWDDSHDPALDAIEQQGLEGAVKGLSPERANLVWDGLEVGAAHVAFGGPAMPGNRC